MTCDLFLGDYAYSSWSLRAWLMFDRFGLPARRTMVWFGKDRSVADQLAELAPPARTVPALRTPEGAVVAESLAIAEELASRHPEAGLWPTDPKVRGIARALAAEMHAGFGPLREYCPMNLRAAYTDVAVPAEVRADLDRITALWAWARAETGTEGPWLCGAYSVADTFYAPVAARIAGYDLPVPPEAADYVAAHLADPSFRRWRAMALVRGDTLPRYARDYRTRPWPGPTPLRARPLGTGPARNDACPYSGRPAAHFLDLDGETWGFCNAFCRDKTAADPEAWPDFLRMTGVTLR